MLGINSSTFGKCANSLRQAVGHTCPPNGKHFVRKGAQGAYSVPRAVVANTNEPGVWQQQNCILLQFRRPEVQNRGVSWLRSFWWLWGRVGPKPLPALDGCLHSLACHHMPWTPPLSSHPSLCVSDCFALSGPLQGCFCCIQVLPSSSTIFPQSLP